MCQSHVLVNTLRNTISTALLDDHQLFLVWYFCSAYRVYKLLVVFWANLHLWYRLTHGHYSVWSARQSCCLPFAVVFKKMIQVKLKCPVNLKKGGNWYPSYSPVFPAIIKASNALCKLSGTSSNYMVLWILVVNFQYIFLCKTSEAYIAIGAFSSGNVAGNTLRSSHTQVLVLRTQVQIVFSVFISFCSEENHVCVAD